MPINCLKYKLLNYILSKFCNTKMPLNPKESANLIAAKAKYVKISQTGIEKLGKKILEELESKRLSPENFSQHEKHPKPSDPWAVDWIFVADTLNFCFWKPEREIGWKVDGYTGYFALCAALTRAQKEGIDITNPRFYATITKEQLSEILRSDTHVSAPLQADRIKCLHEVGEVLINKFGGTFKNCITQCNQSAVKLLDLVIENFPCFRDSAMYRGHEVSFYKRAQILIGDLWACFNNKGFGHFTDISEIAMFADYRVPQSLIYFGALEYTDELNGVLKANTILPYGSRMEVEIRGCSIHAVELAKAWIDANADKERKHANKILKMGIPFHKTLSIYY